MPAKPALQTQAVPAELGAELAPQVTHTSLKEIEFAAHAVHAVAPALENVPLAQAVRTKDKSQDETIRSKRVNSAACPTANRPVQVVLAEFAWNVPLAHAEMRQCYEMGITSTISELTSARGAR